MAVTRSQVMSAADDNGMYLHRGPIVATLILGAFVAILNQTLLNVAIPHLMNTFNVSADTVQWLSTAYMLTNGVVIPLTAFLIGTYTTRQLFMTSMILFLVGSVVCSLAPSFSVMLAGRVIQAAGAGILMPLMMTVIFMIFPSETRGRAMGTVGIAMFFAPAVGPTLSGWLLENYSWRLLFYVVIPIAIIDIIMAVILLKNVTPRTFPKFDVAGVVTSTIGFGSLLYGFSEAGSKGWGSAEVLTTISVGLLFIVIFGVHELTSKTPMLNLRVFKNGMFTLASVVSSVVNMSIYGGALLTPIYVQNVRGYSPLESGLLLLPGAILMGIMSPISGAFLDRFGIRPLAIIGLFITGVTTWEFGHLTLDTPYSHVMVLYTFRMFGLSFIAMTTMTWALNQVPRHLNSHATAAANTIRMVAASLGTAYLVTVMTNRTKLHMAQYANSASLLNPNYHLSLSTLAASLGLTGPTGQTTAASLLYELAYAKSTVQGIDDAFIISAILIAFAFVLSWFLRRAKINRQTTSPVLRERQSQLLAAQAERR